MIPKMLLIKLRWIYIMITRTKTVALLMQSHPVSQILQKMKDLQLFQERFLLNKRILTVEHRNLQIIQISNLIKQPQLVRHKKWLRKDNRSKEKTFLITPKSWMEFMEVMLRRKRREVKRMLTKSITNGLKMHLLKNRQTKTKVILKISLALEEIKQVN